MATCQKPHRNNPYFSQFPKDQGDFSRHKCAGCAYELGYQAGYVKQTVLDMKEAIDSIQESQASEVRHISPLAAYAQGYVNGLMHYYCYQRCKTDPPQRLKTDPGVNLLL